MNLGKIKDFYLFRSILFLGSLSLIFCIIFSLNLYENLYYTSDGFHVYSFLRNINNGQGLYEGPSLENLLGVHSYYTLFLLLPLTKIFATPLILAFVVIGIYLSCSIIIFMICIDNKISKLYSLIISILFFSFGVFSFNGILSRFLFQPDFLAIPFTFAIFLFAKKRSIAGVIISLILLLLTKEEYILWSIFYIPTIYLLFEPTTSVKKKLLSYIASSYLIVSIFSLLLLSIFKSENSSFVGGIKKISIVNIDFKSMFILIFDPSNIIFYWLIFTILMFLSCERKNYTQILINIAPITILIIIRIYSNQIIYGNSNGQYWSFYSVLFPSLYFSLIYTFSFSYKDNIRFYEKNLPKLFLLSLYTTLLTIIIYKGIGRINTNKINIPRIEALSKLNNKIPKILDQKEYFLTDEFLMAPFMQRSHVSLDYILVMYPTKKNNDGTLKSEELQNKIEEVISKASFAILKCDSYNSKSKKKLLEDRGWHSETDIKCSGDFSLMYPPK